MDASERLDMYARDWLRKIVLRGKAKSVVDSAAEAIATLCNCDEIEDGRDFVLEYLDAISGDLKDLAQALRHARDQAEMFSRDLGLGVLFEASARADGSRIVEYVGLEIDSAGEYLCRIYGFSSDGSMESISFSQRMEFDAFVSKFHSWFDSTGPVPGEHPNDDGKSMASLLSEREGGR